MRNCMHPLLSKIKYSKLMWISLISILVCLGILYIFEGKIDKTWFAALTNILIAILTCILVSFWWNKLLLDTNNHYSKSGVKDFFDDFSEAEPIIKKKLKKTKKATIFFMYGKTFLNSSTSQIRKMLSKKGNKLVIVIASEANPFIDQYERFWNYFLKENIQNTPKSLMALFDEIDPKNRGHLQIYLYKDGGYCYSYYMLDNEIYLSPNKMVLAKTFKPITIHAQKTSHKNCLYKKVKQEFNYMLKEKQIELLYDSNSQQEVNQ